MCGVEWCCRVVRSILMLSMHSCKLTDKTELPILSVNVLFHQWEWDGVMDRVNELIKNPLFNNFLMDMFSVILNIHYKLVIVQSFCLACANCPLFKLILIFQMRDDKENGQKMPLNRLAAIVVTSTLLFLMLCVWLLCIFIGKFWPSWLHTKWSSHTTLCLSTNFKIIIYNNFIIRSVFFVCTFLDAKVFHHIQL